MQTRDITEILNKINEMRAVFVLGQRAVPFLEEVFFFLKEISPLIDEINSSIRESTATMPRATSQLQSVSEATELATTEIMDVVDAVLSQLSKLKTHLESTSTNCDRVQESSDALSNTVKAAFGSIGIPVPDEVTAALDTHKQTVAGAAAIVTQQALIIDDIRSRVNCIMNSLQVQDITAQQIASVNHLIESVRSRMAALVERLGTNSPLPVEEVWPIYANANFDPHARYDTGEHRQSMIDSVLSAGVPETLDSQGPPAEVRTDNRVRPEPVNTTAGPASQAEIDALFSNGFA
jgi:chemotaxis regulatin CheY-phosphate phosphatase CheZ